MAEFWIYFQMGLKHILNIYTYSHILFLIALVVPFSFKNWKRILLLITLFTLTNAIALLMSLFGILAIKANVVKLLIPITILIIAIINLFTAGKSGKNKSLNLVFFITLFFGTVHGLGFSNYFKSTLAGSPTSKSLQLSEFSLGIEAGQISVVFVVLILCYIVQTFFRFSKRDWALVMSAFIIGVVLPMIIGNKIWIK